MTDKVLERANEIKAELVGLKQLKQSLKSNVRVTINLDFYENLRRPFIDVLDSIIGKLMEEYEKL